MKTRGIKTIVSNALIKNFLCAECFNLRFKNSHPWPVIYASVVNESLSTGLFRPGYGINFAVDFMYFKYRSPKTLIRSFYS